MARAHVPTVIEIPTSKGVRAKIERLYLEFNTKAQALRLTAQILDDDERQAALTSAPRKFLNAINHRNGAVGRPPEGSPVRKKAKRKWPIQGKGLSLFLLEHLLDDDARPADYLMEQLKAAGVSLESKRSLNGPLGASLGRHGFVKRTRDGYHRTAKGAKYVIELRKRLEESGAIRPGGYSPAA